MRIWSGKDIQHDLLFFRNISDTRKKKSYFKIVIVTIPSVFYVLDCVVVTQLCCGYQLAT